MMQLPVLGSSRTVEAQLPEKVNTHVLFEVVRWQQASRRRGTAATKTRAYVHHTTKKMYGQKHTGRARHGDYGAPIFVGGGITFGPQPRDYSYSLPKKVRKLGLSMALSDRAQNNKLVLVDGFSGVNGKTKEFVAWAKGLGMGEKETMLLVSSNPKVILAARNLPWVRVLQPEGINVYDIMRQDRLVVELSAWESINARLGGQA
jgi:large subunit ribosomal protein L4